MTDRAPYLMTLSGPLSRFRVGRYTRFGPSDPIHIFINTGTSTLSFSLSDAKALAYGILAVASDQFDLATTEEALRLEAEARASRPKPATQNATTTSNFTPNLEDL